MKKSIAKLCSRCKNEIECRMNNIQDCLCSQVSISEECREYLKKTKYDCLCNSCLNILNEMVKQADLAPSKLTENIQYYIENGLLVFTELYHIQRGYCCQSNCRHCAFGFTP